MKLNTELIAQYRYGCLDFYINERLYMFTFFKNVYKETRIFAHDHPLKSVCLVGGVASFVCATLYNDSKIVVLALTGVGTVLSLNFCLTYQNELDDTNVENNYLNSYKSMRYHA